ncbi:MAG: hypothetical protein K0U74_02850 [Alphaproteobacteria bacterium]|nr:hypothetical protein [Alphaproteobacteria bacterium]
MAERRENQSATDDAACPLDTEVRGALERVTTEPPFARSLRLSRFLTYIVEETLAGRSDRLAGYSIGVDVFDKPEDFDPRIDTNVRVEASRLRRSLDQYYRERGSEDPVEIIVPKGTYVPEFRYRAGDRVITAQVAPPDPIEKVSPVRGPSIAVLPFDNFGGNPDDQFFADGLTEETIANLARFNELFVLSRTTSSKLARDGADIRQIREELDVDFVVEGSLRKTSQAVRVTVQLIDAATDSHIFADNFDRACTPEGVFEIQDQIAMQIASRVADRYGPLGRYVYRAKRTGQSRRWETYRWITRFYDYYATHDPVRHAEVRDGLASALEIDHESSDGHAALSIILLDEYRFHINERPEYPALSNALSHAQIAVGCDPENAFAQKALALAYYHSREFTDFEISAERAIQLNPGNATVLADIGHSYWISGKRERGLQLIDRALSLSPVHPGWYHHAPACDLAVSGKPAEAIAEIKQVPMLGFIWHHAFLAWFYAEAADLDAAAREANEVLTICPEFCDIIQNELTIWCADDAMRHVALAGWRKAGLRAA